MSGTSPIPEYPRFAPLAREHREAVSDALAAAQPEISEMTFAYQWVWRTRTRCRVSRLKGGLLMAVDPATTGEPYLLPPITPDRDEAAELIASVLAGGGPANAFARVPESVAGPLKGHGDLAVTEQRDRADYVYLGDDLRELPGKRFHRKRNHVRQFRAACPGAEYASLDGGLAEACMQFTRDWLAGHPKAALPGLSREVDAALAMLDRWRWLGLSAGALVAERRIVAFALGEPINRETFAVRVEKADASVPGAYQAINQEFARRAAARFQWINREQDLGVPGLRRAKQSYCPHHLVRKFEVRLRG